MNASFAAIFEFLEQFAPGVTGHGLEPPDPALRARVAAFARGDLPATEHEGLIRQLQADPALVGYLSETVKGLRGKPSEAGKDRPS